MRLRLSTLLAIAMMAVGVPVIVYSVSAGLAYMAGCLALLAPLALISIPQQYRFFSLFVVAMVWLTHLSRAALLVPFPDIFAYPLLPAPTEPILVRSLVGIAVSAGALVFGLQLRFKVRVQTPHRHPGVMQAERAMPSFLVRHRQLAIGLLMSLVAFRALQQFAWGLQHRVGEANATIGFLSRLVPEDLLYAVGVLYLLKYRREITQRQRLIVGMGLLAMAVMSMLGGSRGFLARIGIAVLIYIIADKGNIRVPVGRAILTSLIAAWMLVISFAVAAPIRASAISGEGLSIAAIAEGARQGMSTENLLFMGNAVTRRFNGLDGYIATEISRPPTLEEAFSPSRVVTLSLQRLVPRFGSGEALSSEKAVGVYYSGHGMDIRHAGAVGLLAAIRLSLGLWHVIGCMLLGACAASAIKAAAGFASPDGRFLFQALVTLAAAEWISSGNFDVLIPNVVITLAFLALAPLIITTIAALLRRPAAAGFQ